MATTTATINLTSPDITGDPLNLIKTATLTKAASNTGLDQFTGVTTVVYAAAQSNTNIVAAAAYADTTTAHKVYIKNSATGTSDYVTVELGGSNTLMGRLYAGDWAFFPWSAVNATSDIKITPSVATSMTLEYMLIYE